MINIHPYLYWRKGSSGYQTWTYTHDYKDFDWGYRKIRNTDSKCPDGKWRYDDNEVDAACESTTTQG